jgi:glucose-6-phosphate 1-epimerase
MVTHMPLDASSSLNNELEELINRCSFLSLISSKNAFPNSKGTGLPLIAVATPSCKALIALQGAHLLSFCAIGGKPLLWVSPNCDFTPGAALRGGIPVCLPWFGPNPLDAQKPKHGFVRNQDWQLSDAKLLADGNAQLTFLFSSKANDLFDFAFSAQLIMTLGSSIKLEIGVTNTDKTDFDCSWALHSYHPVSSLSDVRVKGLSGKTYLDNLEGHAVKIQQDDVSFPNAVDRVFPGVENTVEILGTPHIAIDHQNCPSVVVWNPGSVNAANIPDIGAGNEQGYICVERGAVLAEKWKLNAGETQSACIEITEVK